MNLGSVVGSRRISRRAILIGGTAALGTMATGRSDVRAQPAASRYRRVNVNGSEGPKVMRSYRKAVRAMLELPPEDPRNWYRNALVHALDCPHGNWWFLPWHRGYLGWFEQVCRDLSKDPDFALPYWDWTSNPRVPDGMFEDVLTPKDPTFIPTAAEFKNKFKAAVAAAPYWARTDPFLAASPYGQLLVRGIRMPDDLWFDIMDDPRGKFFFDRAHARGIDRIKPELDRPTREAVSLATVLDGLAPRDFATFGSTRARAHSGLTGFGVLEGQSHNLVHNCVGGVFEEESGDLVDRGGFMQANLSPVDPLFFLHHANIDRLWDVWTRKQLAGGRPILPDGYPRRSEDTVDPRSDFAAWAREPFVFFVGVDGKPVAKVTAGDYASIGDFAYEYEPGSGEEVVRVPVSAAEPQTFVAQVKRSRAEPGLPALADLTLPTGTLRPDDAGNRLFAKVTVSLPPLGHSDRLTVTVAQSGRTQGSPVTLAMFGHHVIQGPVTFTVPLSRSLTTLASTGSAAPASREENGPAADLPVTLSIAPLAATPSHARAHTRDLSVEADGAAEAQLLSVVVEAH